MRNRRPGSVRTLIPTFVFGISISATTFLIQTQSAPSAAPLAPATVMGPYNEGGDCGLKAYDAWVAKKMAGPIIECYKKNGKWYYNS